MKTFQFSAKPGTSSKLRSAMTTTNTTCNLLRDAMLHLKQQNGASLTDIRKHLEANYEETLNPASQKILSSALQTLVQTGVIEKSGDVYKLTPKPVDKKAGSEADDGKEDVPKRTHRYPRGYCKTHSRYHHRYGKNCRRKCHRRRRCHSSRRRRRRSRSRRRRSRRRGHRRRRCRAKCAYKRRHCHRRRRCHIPC